jgi:S1-C subfamily serine protease
MKYVLMILIALAAGPAVASVPDDLQRVSVTIKAGPAQGSGTLVTRKIGENTVTFVWTAAHVVENLRTTRTIVTPQGTQRILIEYRDPEIVQERQQDGRRVGEVKYDCRVIKVSDADYGEDLAVLMVRCKDVYPLSACAKFHKDLNYIPPIGVELSHCGSLLGQFGANSYTTGVLSQTGRTLAGKGATVKVFDQVTAVAFPGSSGGGMFLKEDGAYIGMLTQGVQKMQGFNFIVPMRRIHTWAKDAKIEWAINPSTPMPTMREIDLIPVEDAGQSPGTPSSRPQGVPDEPAFKPPFDFGGVGEWVTMFRSLLK